MAFKKIGKIIEIPAGTAKVYEIGDRNVAICNVDGKFFAVDDICSHDEGSLAFDQDELDGYEIECPRHGARFDVRSGEVTALPAVIPIDTFNVRIEDDDILVEI